jgi:hypothetical protein
MKKNLLILISFLIYGTMSAVEYYTIFGNDHPLIEETYFDFRFDKIENGKLTNIYKKNNESCMTDLIRYLPEANVLLIVNYYLQTNYKEITVYHPDTKTEKRHEVRWDEGISGCIADYYITQGKEPHLIMLADLDGVWSYYDYDINADILTENKEFDLSKVDLLICGNPYIKSVSCEQLAYVINKDNKWEFKRWDASWDINMPLPFKMAEIDYNKDIIWYVNDKDLAVWITNINYTATSDLEESKLVILNKATNQYFYKSYPYGFELVKSTNGWLVSEKNLFLNETVSPGKQARDNLTKQFSNMTNIMFEERTSHYYPGVLMLYHPGTNRTIEIQTNQGDSEVLLVKNDMVYYRVLDTIYKAKITGTTLGAAEKLAQDPNICEVHWLRVEGE